MDKSKSRIKKEQTVEQLKERLKAAKSVVLANQSGLSVSQSSQLKRKLRAVDAEILVAKNTLLKIAAKETGHDLPEEVLQGPTSTLFAYSDEISPIKELAAFAKENEKPVVKAGFLGKTYLSVERVTQLAKLPTKKALRGQLVGGLYSPLYGLANVLNGNIRNLVYTLNAIKEQKGGV